MLLLKLILAPTLIVLVTLATRRWGSTVGGLLMALPVVAGPTLGFYALDHGNEFAAQAAETTLLGLVAVAGFCTSYARAAVSGRRWPLSVLIGWLTFGLLSIVLSGAEFNVFVNLALALIALLVSRWTIATSATARSVIAAPKWDLPLRALAAAVLVLTLTWLAERLGPRLSGVLTPFPVVTAIFAVFTHAQGGPVAVSQFLRRFIPGLCTFAVFCVVLSLTLPAFSVPAAFALALIVQIACQAIVLWRLSVARRSAAPPPPERAEL